MAAAGGVTGVYEDDAWVDPIEQRRDEAKGQRWNTMEWSLMALFPCFCLFLYFFLQFESLLGLDSLTFSGPTVCKRGNLVPWAAPVTRFPHGPQTTAERPKGRV